MGWFSEAYQGTNQNPQKPKARNALLHEANLFGADSA
jgi:hypothetical protein